jgi:hypothetical protein
MADSSKLLIPPKLHVGFNRRTDTYTNILGFIIYTDTKGVKHTETSWNNWRNQEIPAIDCDNVPTEGFVLNGKVGGGRSYGWHSNERIMKVRVFDPRNWEFEITIPNLLNILRDSACSPGKGLEGKFVYAWAGKQLILLPEKSEDYRKSSAFTALQSKTVKAKALVPGHTYLTKRQLKWVYLGKFEYYFAETEDEKTAGGWRWKHVFAKHEGDKWQLVYQNDVKAVAEVASDQTVENLAELVEMHTRSARGSRIVKLLVKPSRADPNRRNYHGVTWVYEHEPGVFSIVSGHWNHGNSKIDHATVSYDLHVKDGVLHVAGDGYRENRAYMYAPSYGGQRQVYDHHKRQYVSPVTRPWREPEYTELYALLECGAEVPISPYDMRRD